MRACEFISEDFSANRSLLKLPARKIVGTYGKSYQGDDDYDEFSPENLHKITPSDFDKIERDANQEWNPDGVGINIHTKSRNNPSGESHIVQQANHPRNKPPITPDEIEDVFVDAHKFARARKAITNLDAGDEVVLKGTQSNINIPIMATEPRKRYSDDVDLEIVPKTIMRTPNYKTSNTVINVPKMGPVKRGF